MLGDYELLEEIARGGMGVVYRARQRSLGRIVALKTILAGPSARLEDVARFRQEAEAAAYLQHPNIVAIHEVGECNGQHFFSMDYVEGRTLRQLTLDHPLPAQQAAGLLRTIAEAVHYAHTQGVVHRDLKPSNVLLDAAGHPHVTDFGLAKHIGTDGDLTVTHAAIGTPGYMPPEQASGQSKAAGPLADVFALGAMLYDLLTGRPPFRGETPLETMAQTVQTEPIAPCLLNATLPRDLETICLKCLEKEPSRRYQSALALAEDIARHQNHQPILAQPLSTIYRARKFVRRHRVAVAVAAGFVALLTVATVVSTVFGVRASRALDKAIQAQTETEKAEKTATRKAEEADAVLRFLRDHVLAASRPAGRLGGLGTDITLQRALDAAEPKVAQLFQNQPMIEAGIRSALGDTYHYLGHYSNAVAQYERALSCTQSVRDPTDPITMTLLNNLATAYQYAGRWSEAISLHEQVWARRSTALGANDRSTLLSLNNLATAYLESDRAAEAMALLEPAIQAEVFQRNPTNSESLTCLHNLALAYAKSGRWTEAAARFEDVIARRKASLSVKHPDTLKSMNTLGQTYRKAHRLVEAISLLEETLRLRSEILGADHPDTLESMFSLSGAYREAGRLPEAIPLAEQAWAGRNATLGTDHPETLYALNSLATAYTRAGRLPEATALFEQERALHEARFGPDHPSTLTSMQNLATAYVELGRLPEAMRLFETTLQLRQQKLGPGHADTLLTLFSLGLTCQRVGELSTALDLFGQGLELSRTHLKPDHWVTAKILEHFADACLATNRLADARNLLVEFLDLQSKTLPADSSTLAATRTKLGECLLRMNLSAEAVPILRRSLAVLQQKQSGLSPMFHAQALLGWALIGQNSYPEAEPLLAQAYEGLKKRQAERPSASRAKLIRETADHLVRLYEAWGKPEQAAQWRAKSP